MSGVIDDKGQQWERCGHCATFIRFPQNLGYVKTTTYHMDICVKCVDELIQAERIKFEDVIPAPEWVIKEPT